MKQVFNKDGFQWFIGVVEDRDDPEKLGRCKVRIYGHNSQLKSEQPTHDLPWAVPIQPITSAAISGIGNSPIGPLPGSWVVGFYLDGNDMQQPAFFGTIGSSSAPTVFQETLGKPNFTLKDNDDTLKDQSGQVISKENRISDGTKAIKSLAAPSFPVKVGVPQNPNNPEPPNKPSTIPPTPKKSYISPNAKASGILPIDENIVSLSKSTDQKFVTSATSFLVREANKVTPSSTEEPTDIFGFRYGVYRFASFLPAVAPDGTRRPSAKTSPLQSFLNSEFGQPFKDLFKHDIGTLEFNVTWLKYGVESPPLFESGEKEHLRKQAFFLAQAEYIGKTYTLPVKAHIKRLGGPTFGGGKLSTQGTIALHSLNLSLALDLGIVGAAEVITKACEGKSNLSKVDVIELVTEYLIQNSDEVYSKLPQEERDQIKVDQLNQREGFKQVETPPYNPTSSFGDYGSGFNLSVGFEGTPDEKLVYNGNDKTIYDRINNERIRRGLPRLSNPRPTGEGNREVKSTFGGTTDRFGNKVTSKK